MANRILRPLSCFNPSTLRWTPILSKSAQSQVRQSQLPQRLSLTSRFSIITWNVDFRSPRPVSRTNSILDYILKEPRTPDIIFLQEVRSDVRASLLGNRKVREAFLTDAEDDKDKSFATMTLLSTKRFASDLGDGIEGEEKFMVGPVSCVELPSAYGRDGLCVDIIPPTAPDTVFRLINVHLDSLERLPYRTQQLEILAKVLREPGCSGGLIGGDFNSISPGDDELVDKNGLVDAWLALHGSTDPDAPTWGVGRGREVGLKPKRLDKVAMMGLRAEEMEILPQGLIEVPKPGGDSALLEWSDHSGLRCVFTI